jgi:mannitol-1-phosphate 5-dehydrogenase
VKAVIFGSGRIGCGFAGHLLGEAGYELSFLSRNAEVVAHLNRVGGYRVLLAHGRERTEHAIRGVRALHTAQQAEDCVAALREADVIVTAVGPTELGAIAPLLAAGLAGRAAPVNVLAFENLADAGAELRARVAECLPAGFELARFGFSGTLVTRAVTQCIGDPAEDKPLVFVGDPPAELVVDGRSLVQPLPQLPTMVVADAFAAWMQRKLFIFSAGHATCAYLGHLKGYRYIHSAIRDEEIRAAVLQAMSEGQRGIAALYGEAFAGGPAHLEQILDRFGNAAITDPVSRVARDPSRKLSAGDRLLGAARLAEQAGVHPHQLLRAAAAAYCFRDPADAVAARLQEEIRVAGLRRTMHRVSGLGARDRLGQAVARHWRQLTRQWHGDSVLLNLDRVHWA